MSHRLFVSVLPDNSNVFKSIRRLNWRIDVEKLIASIEKDGPIWQTYFFAAVSEPPRFAQTNFYKMLKNKLHWETLILPLGSKTISCKNCKCTRRESTEKGVDVAIATKLLTHAINRAYDTAILISGDKDYLETVKAVKNLGLRVEIIGFHHSMSRDLADESSVPVLYLDDIKKEIELIKIDMETEKLLPTDEEVVEDTPSAS